MLLGIKNSLIIGINSLLEAIRNRILWIVIFFTFILLFFSILIGSLSLGEHSRFIIDMGLASASIIGTVLAISLFVSSFWGDIKRRTIYPLLVRPIPKWSYILGRYMGNIWVVILITQFILMITAIIVFVYGDTIPNAFWVNMCIVPIEMMVVTSVVLFFSMISKPVLSVSYTISFLIAGNFSQDMIRLSLELKKQEEFFLANIMKLIYYILPDLSAFSLRSHASNNLEVPNDFLLSTTFYGISYSMVGILCAMWIFSQKKFI